MAVRTVVRVEDDALVVGDLLLRAGCGDDVGRFSRMPHKTVAATCAGSMTVDQDVSISDMNARRSKVRVSS